MRQRSFSQQAAYVAAGHGIVLILLMLLPMIPGFFQRPTEAITMIDFVVDTRTEKGDGGEPEEALEEPTPPEKIPEPTPVKAVAPDPDEMPAPKKPEQKKEEPKKKPDPPKTAKKPIQIGPKVKRPGAVDPLTAQQIRDRLALGARVGTFNSAIPSEDQLGLVRIRNVLYNAWSQPAREAVGGRTVEATLRLDLDGTVLDRSITKRSGIAEFDTSVEQAINAVNRIPGLTVAFVQKHRTVSIAFEVR